VNDLPQDEDLFAAAGRYGYLHPTYAEAFSEVGQMRHLRRGGTWMVTRGVPGSERRDAIVGYPRLICRDWLGLVEDLAETAALADVVTVSALTDALADLDEELLRPAFGDLVRVEAQHNVIDLAAFWPSREHRRATRRALQLVDVEVEDAPAGSLPGWRALGGGPLPGAELGLSDQALERQLALPGCVGFTVHAAEGPVAAAIVYVSGENAYLHALAPSQADPAPAHEARYALVQAMVEDMRGRGLQLLDLGPAAEDADFLAGWTGLTRPAYRCGRIVDRVAYDELVAAAGTSGSAIFPAYRDPAARLRA
jgi:hypothetical protein